LGPLSFLGLALQQASLPQQELPEPRLGKGPPEAQLAESRAVSRDTKTIMAFQKTKGQAMVEFVSLAPLVFLIFFGIIQLSYMAFIAFAVQQTAFSIAKNAAASNNPESYDPTFQLVYSLTPIGKLNQNTLITILATQCRIQTDGKKVHVVVQYPMPIWIPVIQNIFGEKLSISPNTILPDQSLLNQVFAVVGVSPPDLSPQNLNLPYVRWMSFSADAMDENYLNPKLTNENL
jgi:hypothetical protein